MKAIVLKEFGGVENLEERELPKPQVSATEILVAVRAIGINPVDVKTRAGKGLAAYMKEFDPLILGWDISGVVVELGVGVTTFELGDEVFGLVNFPGHGQAYAEYVLAPAGHLALKPKNISHEEAAAATLAALTAWQALNVHASIKLGDRVLIHAASGGVGHYAVQLAKHLGAYVIGTSSAINKDFVLSLGADEHIDYQNQTLEGSVRDLDFVLDTIGGETTDHSLNVTKEGGTVISIPSGLTQAMIDKAKERGIIGFFFLVQSSGDHMRMLADLLERKILRSIVAETFTFGEMGHAHLRVETGRTKGKVIVTI